MASAVMPGSVLEHVQNSMPGSETICSTVKNYIWDKICCCCPGNLFFKFHADGGVVASNVKDLLQENNDPVAGTSGAVSLEAERIKTMEEQLSTLQAENGRLNAELREKQRNEENRLETELKTATESLKELKATNEKQMMELFQLRGELGSIAKEKLDLTKQLEQNEQTYRSELDNLKERLQQTEFKNTELTDQLQNLKDNLQTTAEQLNGAITQNIKLEQKNRETESENHRNHAQLDAANAKIIELRRAIQILESNPFTTTTAQMQREGTFSCPLCGESFGSLANMQLHAEDCNG